MTCQNSQRYKVLVSYDGTDFFGWQKQSGWRTVQQTMEKAIFPLSKHEEPISVIGSGRTDSGVHARGQVAHFDLNREISPVKLLRAINGKLPDDVRVLSAEPVDHSFHACRSAIKKEYRYKIWNNEVMYPILNRYYAHIVTKIDIDSLKEAASYFVGEHDFASFIANSSREIESTVRTIYSIDIITEEPSIEIRVTGNGFLYKMVRSITGFLIAVGIGKEKPTAANEIMESKMRTARVETAPAKGLTLWEVWY